MLWLRCIVQILLTIALIVGSSIASETSCPEHYPGGKAPDLLNQELAQSAREICYSGYAVLHSSKTRTPIYAVEHLTRERILKAKRVKRSGRFHPDENIPESERAELGHYANNGYDLGHMAPVADMPDDQSMYESFSLANVVPQNPKNNRGVWAKIEAEVRSLVLEQDSLYVITGTIFNDSAINVIGRVVGVPVKLFKAVYDVQKQEGWGYIVNNSAEGRVVQISIRELEDMTGIIVLPP